MKKWEEQQRKKIYNSRIQQAKPTLATQPKSSQGTRTRQSAMQLSGQGQQMITMRNLNTAAGGYTQGVFTAEDFNSDGSNFMMVQSPIMSAYAGGGGGQQQQFQTPGSQSHYPQDSVINSSQSSSTKRADLPIFQLLKAFKLQQYAQKLSEVGYGQDIYKLALLNDNQRNELISSLKVLPGHKAKLMSLFDVIDEIYPKKMVAEQLKQFQTPNSQVQNKQMKFKRSGTTGGAFGGNGRNPRGNQNNFGTVYGGGGGSRGFHQLNPKSLIHQYEALDPSTKQAFNSNFLLNLESVKYSIPQLFQQHISQQETQNAINFIFPPSYFQQNMMLPQQQQQYQQQQQMSTYQTEHSQNLSGYHYPVTTGYDAAEIENLVTKYVGRAAQQTAKLPYQLAQRQTTSGTRQTSNPRQSTSQTRKAGAEDTAHLKQEMAQTMKVIERINKEFEQLTKSSQQEYDHIRENQRQRDRNPFKGQVAQSVGQPPRKNSLGAGGSTTSKQSTNSSQQMKPGSVTSSKRQEPQKPSIVKTTASARNNPPVGKTQTPQQQASFQTQQDIGRYQSNRAMAKVQQKTTTGQMLMNPRVITEHEIASEMTTPHSKAFATTTNGLNRERSSNQNSRSRERPSAMDNQGTSVMTTSMANGMRLTGVSNFPQQFNDTSKPHSERKQNPLIPPSVSNPVYQETIQHSSMEVEENHELRIQPIPVEVKDGFKLPDDDEEEDNYDYQDDNEDEDQSEEEEEETIGSPKVVLPQKQAPEKRRLSPLLDQTERELLWNNALGHSLDSKQVASALGYLDLKQICLCLAHALNRHIQFSQGFYFLDDLQEQIKALQLEDELKLDFSYSIPPEMKIDIEGAKKRKKEKDAQAIEQTKREFEELKAKLETDTAADIKKPAVFVYQPHTKQQRVRDIGNSILTEPDQFDRAENDTYLQGDDIEFEPEEEEETGMSPKKRGRIVAGTEDEQYIQDFYGNNSAGQNTLEKQVVTGVPHRQLKSQGNFKASEHEEEEEEGVDLDYSYSHLDEFLRSQRGAGSLVAPSSHMPANINNSIQSKLPISVGASAAATTTQQLMNTFLTSYQKNKGSVRLSNGKEAPFSIAPLQEVIKEAAADSSGVSNTVIGEGEQSMLSSMPARAGEEDGKIKIDVRTKEGFKDLIRWQMRIYDLNYDFETDQVMECVLPDENPTLEELYYYCKYVIVSGRMEKEIPILCLVYIERFLSKTGILLNHLNWRRLTLISLCLASKIWDDDSLENVHFPKVMPDITVKEIASLEKVFLQFLDFDLIIRGAEYAKYYFIMKTFAHNIPGGMNSCLPPVGPLTAQKMSDLQNNTGKVENELREKYEIKLSLAKTMQGQNSWGGYEK